MGDLKYVLRTLARSPAFFVTGALTLALGIAANTAMFALFYQVLMRTLPVPQPDRLVVLHSDPPNLPGGTSSDNFETVFSYPMYLRLRDGASSVLNLAVRSGSGLQLGDGATAQRAAADFISGNFFDVLGVRPAMGRLIGTIDDGQPGTSPVCVLSFDAWTRWFAASPATLNSTIHLNGHAYTVVGVTPQGFRGVLAGQSPDVFLPISMYATMAPGRDPYNQPGSQWLTIIGRLRPSVTREKAAAALQPLFASTLTAQLDELNVKRASVRARVLAKRVEVRPASQGLNQLERQWRQPLLVLAAMASLLLLIACANLANLLAARAAGRAREINVRLALGAPRWSIMRLLLIESGLLAITGTVAGVLLAPVLDRTLLTFLPEDSLGGWVTGGIDTPLLAFSAALMIATTILCGIAPSLQALRRATATLSIRSRTAAHTGLGRKVLVGSQIALSLVLLATAGLFARSLTNLMHHQFGFRPDHVMTFWVRPALNGYDVERGILYTRQLRARLESLPGVGSVAVSDDSPLSGNDASTNVTIEGYTAKGDDDTQVNILSVGPGYFRTIGTPLIDGREFTDRDDRSAPKVVIVNEAFARKFLPHGATGRHMTRGSGGKLESEIVGVVADSQHYSLRQAAPPLYFMPYEQTLIEAKVMRPATYLIHASQGFETLPGAIRQAAAAVDANVSVFGLHTLQQQVDDSIYVDRLLAALSTAFSILAVVLTAVGLYGVISYLVARRTTEIGVRMALGATRANIMAMVLGEVALVLAAGGVLGLLLAWVAARAVQSQLFGMQGFDLAVFVAAALVLAAIALSAGAIPAVRAARIEPMSALREE